jgi:hypothetical protein
MPDDARRSLSLWTCAELARALKSEGIVEDISLRTVQRLLESPKLRPWRVHHGSTWFIHDERLEAYQVALDFFDLEAHERGRHMLLERIVAMLIKPCRALRDN